MTGISSVGAAAATPAVSASGDAQKAVAAAAQALAGGAKAGGTDADGDNDGTKAAGPTGNGTTVTKFA